MKTTIFENKQIIVTSLGLKNPQWNPKNEVRAYGIYIAQLKGMNTHNFIFYDSIHNTHENPSPRTLSDPKGLMYDILACVEMDYGIDLDSNELVPQDMTIKQLKEWTQKTSEHVEKLKQLFSESEIEQLTENDDRLKAFVEKLEIREK